MAPDRYRLYYSEALSVGPMTSAPGIPPLPNGDRHMPGPGAVPQPDIKVVRGPMEYSRHLRMALDLLEEALPLAYESDGLLAELWALREKLAAAELIQLRKIGHREYLVIRPLAPAATGPLITKAAEAVKILDDLGLVIRLA